MAPYGKDSALDFGKPRLDRMRDPEELVWIDLLEDFYWSAYCKGFAIGAFENGWSWGSIRDQEETVSDNSIYSMFDTGASQIIIPENYFPAFLEQLFGAMADKEYELKDGYVVSKCYEDFPAAHFLYGENWISIYADEYVVDISEKQDRSICALLFGQGEQPFLVMGLPAYMDYYTVHDETNKRIGFAPHKDSNKSPLEKGEQPTRAFGSGDSPAKPVSIWTWVTSVVVILAFAGLWVGAIMKVNRDNNKDGKRNNDDNDKKEIGIWIGVACVATLLFGFLIFSFFFPWFNNVIVDDVKGSYEGNEILVMGSILGLAAYASRKDSNSSDVRE